MPRNKEQHSMAQSKNLKQVQDDKIIGEGIKTRSKEARSYETKDITSKGHIS